MRAFGKKDDPFFYSRIFLRRISAPLVRPAVALHITPNQITLASIGLGLVAIYLFLAGELRLDLVGLLLFQASTLLDCLDGDLARFHRLSSPDAKNTIAGSFLDYSRDIILGPLLPISLAIGYHNSDPSLALVIIVVIGAVLKLVPQQAREHVLTAQLRKGNRAYLDLLVSRAVLEDTLAVKGCRRSSPLHFSIKVAKGLFGFPNGLMNTMTVIAMVGVVYDAQLAMLAKGLTLWATGLLYNLNFLYTYLSEYKRLRGLPPASSLEKE